MASKIHKTISSNGATNIYRCDADLTPPHAFGYQSYEHIYKHHSTFPSYAFFPKGYTEPTTWRFYANNKEHRWNGPAQYSIFSLYNNWYIHGMQIPYGDYFTFLDENGIDINNISDADKILITLWSQDVW